MNETVVVPNNSAAWALSRQISIGDFRHRIRPGALVFREQKKWRSSPPWSASRQYRIYSDNAPLASQKRAPTVCRTTRRGECRSTWRAAPLARSPEYPLLMSMLGTLERLPARFAARRRSRCAELPPPRSSWLWHGHEVWGGKRRLPSERRDRGPSASEPPPARSRSGSR
jgi:hypothetical protein